MKNLDKNSAETRWLGARGIGKGLAALVLSVSLLPAFAASNDSHLTEDATGTVAVSQSPKGNSITGVVTDSKGNPVAGAAITIVGGSGGVPLPIVQVIMSSVV